MFTEIQIYLPEAQKARSYDHSVWAHFTHGGTEYQIFDEWNFGADIKKTDPKRFWLSRVTGEYRDRDESNYIGLGRYASVKAACEAVKARS